MSCAVQERKKRAGLVLGIANVPGSFVWEPRELLESVAVQLSEHGIDFEAVAGRGHGSLTRSDFALAVASAGDALGQAAFFARWLDDAAAQRELATLLLPLSQVADQYRLKLSAAATWAYIHNGASPREVCRAMRVSQSITWPKLEKHYLTMLSSCYSAEAKFARALQAILR